MMPAFASLVTSSKSPRPGGLNCRLYGRAERINLVQRTRSDANEETLSVPLTFKMVASEILMCGLKHAPFVGPAVEVLDSIKLKHELVGQSDHLAEIEGKLSRFERAQRDLVAQEIRTILDNFRHPDLSGPALTEEIRNLRQIQEQGWNPSLFEGLFLNSSHLEELKRNPNHYGRILGDHDPVDPEKGIHVLLDAGKTRILELPPFAFSQLLAHQAHGVPDARIQVGEGVWAFPKLGNSVARNPVIDESTARQATKIVVPRPVSAGTSGNEIVNSIGMKLKLIPVGEFQMGSNEYDSEKPRHLVTISQPFYLGVYPVTQHEYMQTTKKNPSGFSGNHRRPVESVSWFDAVAFCNELSRKEGLKPFFTINAQSVEVPDWNGPGYRLPTEAEWEYACRARTTTRFSFGDDENLLSEHAWYYENSGSQTHPVGEKKPNPFGLFDMHGNVWEWCWDWFDASYYNKSSQVDPKGQKTGDARVLRGGSWYYVAFRARSAFRRGLAPAGRIQDYGFRLARTYY
jgi:formylglycine-generating enzyme required for sulfatase activity